MNCIVITTLSDNLDIIINISNELISRHLVASSHISKIESAYWWNDKVNKTIEYKLEVRTNLYLYEKIEKLIKELHNYELPEITYYEIKGSKEIVNWINDNVNGGDNND